MRTSSAQRAWGIVLLIAALGLAAGTVLVAIQKHPNTPLAAVLQGLALLFSAVGAYVFAQASVQSAAQELISKQARSPFRRVRAIYRELGQLLEILDRQSSQFLVLREGNDPGTLNYEYVAMTMQMLRHSVTSQANTADDAMADWRDLVPDEVAQIEQQTRELEGDSDAA
jgi:hypothetical protein